MQAKTGTLHGQHLDRKVSEIDLGCRILIRIASGACAHLAGTRQLIACGAQSCGPILIGTELCTEGPAACGTVKVKLIL